MTIFEEPKLAKVFDGCGETNGEGRHTETVHLERGRRGFKVTRTQTEGGVPEMSRWHSKAEAA